ncbi:hypothetical protein LSH36_60g04056 [Paralvinella palmiformis]|uniref:Uncharacterized protein n=1 Tax=Paralvinella palmiformis TaxID=53620 RepID=A0AAD9K4I9_9ANNE|nr:hypothetical protein LSH36_60g04056 [Paralvinella palmiformis]
MCMCGLSFSLPVIILHKNTFFPTAHFIQIARMSIADLPSLGNTFTLENYVAAWLPCSVTDASCPSHQGSAPTSRRLINKSFVKPDSIKTRGIFSLSLSLSFSAYQIYIARRPSLAINTFIYSSHIP